MSRALLSVSDKTGIENFAKGLVEKGFEILSTGGTRARLEAAGVPVHWGGCASEAGPGEVLSNTHASCCPLHLAS